MANNLKQAVVLVHGIGEQRPMDTVREFVKSVWVKDQALDNTRYWNKPSEISGSFEHRRLTTDYATIRDEPNGKKTSRVDFYEYYWAHHTVGTSLEHVKSWLLSVMLRKPSDFPKPLQPLLFLVWSLVVLIALIFWFSAKPEEATSVTQGKDVLAILSAAYFTYIKPILLVLLSILLVKIVAYLGDVARYVTASPSNIKVRQAIRDGGMTLLQSIAATGKYDRIVVVGHSLGSIIAYDILTQYWAQNNKLKSTAGEPLDLSESSLALIAQMEALTNGNESQNYRELQRALFDQLQLDCANQTDNEHQHNPWLVSDLITLGSPLTYADFLLFKNKKEFSERKLDRQYPTCPPVKEAGRFTYETGGKRYLHHSALFCPVKWSNVYSPSHYIFGGDIISGPIATAFSPPKTQNGIAPIDDRAVEAAFPGKFPRLFTHNNYWKWHSSYESQVPEHLKVLREVLNLKDR